MTMRHFLNLLVDPGLLHLHRVYLPSRDSSTVDQYWSLVQTWEVEKRRGNDRRLNNIPIECANRKPRPEDLFMRVSLTFALEVEDVRGSVVDSSHVLHQNVQRVFTSLTGKLL